MENQEPIGRRRPKLIVANDPHGLAVRQLAVALRGFGSEPNAKSFRNIQEAFAGLLRTPNPAVEDFDERTGA